MVYGSPKSDDGGAIFYFLELFFSKIKSRISWIYSTLPDKNLLTRFTTFSLGSIGVCWGLFFKESHKTAFVGVCWGLLGAYGILK